MHCSLWWCGAAAAPGGSGGGGVAAAAAANLGTTVCLRLHDLSFDLLSVASRHRATVELGADRSWRDQCCWLEKPREFQGFRVMISSQTPGRI